MVLIPIIFSIREVKKMEMKKAAQIGAGIALAGAIGYGAWYMYAKTNPKSARELKKSIQKMSKDVEKSMEDMM